MMKKIALSGGSGFIGQSFLNSFNDKYEFIHLDRALLYDARKLADALPGVHAIVHLAGAPVIKRWTENYKKILWQSRVETTANLASALQQLDPAERPSVFIGASAIGIYRVQSMHDEQSQDFAPGFLGDLGKAWEAASGDVLSLNMRRVIMRIGVVLGPGGALAKMRLPFSLGLGGVVGNGKQPFPWIHLEDLLHFIDDAIVTDQYNGIYNLVAPDQIDNRRFTKALSRAIGKPAFLPVPGVALKLLYGKAAGLLLTAPEVDPARLKEMNFPFQYPQIDDALKAIL
jgi:uncharacterized protein (TIGR01777 family)